MQLKLVFLFFILGISLGVSKQLLWPQPKKIEKLNQNQNALIIFSPQLKFFSNNNLFTSNEIRSLFTSRIKNKNIQPMENIALLKYKKFNYIFNITIECQNEYRSQFNVQTEKYKLIIDNSQILIKAEYKNGVYQAFTTLAQLISLKRIQGKNHYTIEEGPMIIEDEPAYNYRGITIDTSRNFIPIEDLKGVLDVMSLLKLNILHLHLTDTSSWPIFIQKHPWLTQYGAYSNQKVYSKENIKHLKQYAQVRGVTLIPEIDCPAHSAYKFDNQEIQQRFGQVVKCTQQKYNTWAYANEPPAGQWNIENPNVTQILQDVWSELTQDFGAGAAHIGMDEVNFQCTAEQTQYENGTAEQKKNYTKQAFNKFAQQISDYIQKDLDQHLIIWQDAIIDYDVKIKNTQNATLHIWDYDNSNLQQRQKFDAVCSQNNFTLIQSNYKYYYLDCGGANWISGGAYWCPYANWQNIYIRDLKAELPDSCKNKVIGSSLAIWTENIDSSNLYIRLLPRMIAFSERLWYNPPNTALNSDSYEGYKVWIEFLPQLRSVIKQFKSQGIQTLPLQPESCYDSNGSNICRQYSDSLYVNDVGYYRNYATRTVEKCPKGQACPGNSSINIQCDATKGQYQDEVGQEKCKTCENPREQFVLNSTSKCLNCNQLGSCFCCNGDGTYKACPSGKCDCYYKWQATCSDYQLNYN